MRKFLLVGMLLLPLPFAGLPVVGVLLAGDAASPGALVTNAPGPGGDEMDTVTPRLSAQADHLLGEPGCPHDRAPAAES
jgi:hypothetical protein